MWVIILVNLNTRLDKVCFIKYQSTWKTFNITWRMFFARYQNKSNSYHFICVTFQLKRWQCISYCIATSYPLFLQYFSVPLCVCVCDSGGMFSVSYEGHHRKWVRLCLAVVVLTIALFRIVFRHHKCVLYNQYVKAVFFNQFCPARHSILSNMLSRY